MARQIRFYETGGPVRAHRDLEAGKTTDSSIFMIKGG